MLDLKTDSLTHEIIEISDHFVQYDGRIETIAGRIKSDNLHLLIHTDVGNGPGDHPVGRVKTGARSNARDGGIPSPLDCLPLIITYPGDLMETNRLQQSHYCEKLIKLPNLALGYDPPVLPEPSRYEIGTGFT